MERLYLSENLSMGKLAKHYGVGIGTIHRWIHQLEIPARPKATNAIVAVKRGRKMRLCKGVLHPEGEWVKESNFHHYRKVGRKNKVIRLTCLDCDEMAGRRHSVAYSPIYQGWVKSIINRLGVMEAARRIGIHDHTLRRWRASDKPKHLWRPHAKAIVRVMGELRVTGEVRHRDSIHYGATARGGDEKAVQRSADLYRRHGDHDTEVRRRHRLTS
jgi:transposase-like protein